MTVLDSVKTRRAGARLGGAAIFVLIVAAVTVAAAWAFELIGGYRPCPLCLIQRIPYYVVIPLAGLSLVALATLRLRPAQFLLFLAGITMLVSFGLGVYHAGIEWGFWPGPDTCGGATAAAGNVTDLLGQVQSERVVRCDAAAWRFFGLSFAGWNAVISALLALVALAAAARPYGRADRRM